MPGQAQIAEEARPASHGEGNDDAVSRAHRRHFPANFFHDAHEFMPHDHVLHLGKESVVDVQIRATDRGAGDAQDDVLRMLELGIRHVVDGHFSGMMKNQGLHKFR